MEKDEISVRAADSETLLEIKRNRIVLENGQEIPIQEVIARAFNMEERFRTLMAYYKCAIMEVD